MCHPIIYPHDAALDMIEEYIEAALVALNKGYARDRIDHAGVAVGVLAKLLPRTEVYAMDTPELQRHVMERLRGLRLKANVLEVIHGPLRHVIGVLERQWENQLVPAKTWLALSLIS